VIQQGAEGRHAIGRLAAAGTGIFNERRCVLAPLHGVLVFNPPGKPIGHIQLPERCANLCFGGAKGDRLFMAASQFLYGLDGETQGVV